MQLIDSLNEFAEAIKKHDLWLYLSYTDIRQRYRRSLLGPLWLTLSTAIFIGMLSIVWSTLFKQNLTDYLPFFSIGYIIWVYISTQIGDACTGFTQFEYLIKQIRLPFPIFILRIISRNIIIFMHNFIVIIFILAFVGKGWSVFSLFSIIGFIILSITLFSFSLIIAMITTRYRDFQMIIQNALPIVFYISPIMWQSRLIPEKYYWIIQYNPIVPFIELIRDPMFGVLPVYSVWIQAIISMLLVSIVAVISFSIYRKKIAYWL